MALNVLLVEDSPTDALLTREALAEAGQFRLRSSGRLAEAMRVLAEAHFDVVLLDLGLPDSQGLETLRRLRDEHDKVAVIVLTGRDDEELAVRALQGGAEDYLVKHQSDPAQLRRAVRYAVERAQAAERLRESERLFHQLADAMPQIVWAAQPDGHVNYYNQRWTDYTGVPKDAAGDESWQPFFHPDDLPNTARAWAEAVRTGQPLQTEARIKGQDAGYRWHLSRAVPVREGGGEVARWIGTATDIEDIKRAERELRERSELAELAAEVGSAFAAGGSLDAILQECTEALVRHLGAAFARIWTLDDAGAALELRASAGLYTHLDGPHGRVPVGQFKIGRIARDRKPHMTNAVVGDPEVSDQEWARREGMVSFAGYPLVAEGRVVGVLAVFARHPLTDLTLREMQAVADVTAVGIERSQTEEARHALLARLQLQIERMPLAYVLFDREFRVTDWNPAAERTFGYLRSEALGMHPLRLVPPSFRPQGEQILNRIRGGDMQAHSVNENVTRDGRTITCEWYNTPLLRDGGEFEGLLCLAQDVTARISLEQQFRQAQKMEAIGSLAGGVAHDFNNLLTIINGYSELIQSQLPDDSPVGELAREIGQAGERAAGLTRQLLAFSRKQVLEPRVLSLNSVVTDTARMLKRLIGEDIDLATALDPALGRVKADPGQVEQVLINLVVNSRDAMPRGGKVTIETANAELHRAYTDAIPDLRPGRYVMLAVSDTGTGMDKATMARIFEPFFTTKGEGKGTGLGLATVFGIVKQSGGHVAVYSEPGRGATFKVYLPRVDAGDPAGVAMAAPPVAPRGTETVLLVEDEPALLALSRHLLAAQGYTVLEAGNGEKAIRLAEQYGGAIHLLVTDVVMPGLSGRQVAERVTALRPGVRVLFLSGYTDDAVIRHGVLQADAAFLQKPYTPASLAQKVRAVLDQPTPVGGADPPGA